MSDPHVNYSSDWTTSEAWWAWAEATLGAIDLDPCGDHRYPGAAQRSFTGGHGIDGLSQPWPGRVYCNPPGSNSTKSIKPWWEHALAELAAERTTDLVWCFFNMETVFSLRPSPLDLHGWLTMPSKRVAFWRDGAPPVNPITGRKVSPRNRTWFWSTRRPAVPPIMSWICETGDANVEQLSAWNGEAVSA